MIYLSDFEGLWHIERVVDDARGPSATFTGLASFEPGENGLVLNEAGALSISGQGSFQASRRYCWSVEGVGITVAFDDGRPFHWFDPNSRLVQSAHWCDPDQYDVTYDFTDWPNWSAAWHVCGPRKDYQMKSTYRRVI